jgi:hypothetical protein
MMTILFRSNKGLMLTALIFAGSLLIPIWCVGQTESSVRSSTNEFHPGELWYDTSGTPINAHGGGFLYRDHTYYWFGEFKTEGRSLCSYTAQSGHHCRYVLQSIFQYVRFHLGQSP